jgi:hypothetical protein
MFGRVINKIFKRGSIPTKPATETDETDSAGASPFARTNAPSKATLPEPVANPGKKAEPAKGAPAANAADTVKKQWAAKSGQKLNTKESPEILCGITKQMSKEEIAKKLAELYRRHNRAASSLDPQMREDAEIMLEASASAKEKFLLKK